MDTEHDNGDSGPHAPTIEDCRSKRGSVWDLDQTLVATDTFAEQLTTLVFRKPWMFGSICLWMAGGRVHCKARVAEASGTPPDTWPVRPDVLARVLADRRDGCTTVLATAAHRSVAQPLADHLSCFDIVLASDNGLNLKAHVKANTLASLAHREGWSHFSYGGDSTADLPVWRVADDVIVVNPTTSLLRRIEKLGKQVTVVGRPQSPWWALATACRPHQWAKNALIFVPMVLAHRFDLSTVAHVLAAFCAFSLCASAIYLLNDINDIQVDRRHPTKRTRAFAAGRATIPRGLLLAVALIAVSLALALATVSVVFAGLLVLYICANALYSSQMKQFPIVDVLMLACMYALRLEAGAVAATVQLSDWLLTFSLFFFTSLAFAKRFTELRRMDAAGGQTTTGRGYRVSDIAMLQMLGSASGYVSVLVLALYMNSDSMRSLYGHNRVLWLACPLVLYWVTRLWLLASRGLLDEDPVVFALTDRTSLLVGVACALLFVLASLTAGV